MKWSQNQNLCLKSIKQFLNSPNQVFYLAGYAGTGKTTLAIEIKNMVDGDVMYGAYTGKAVSVLRNKGCSPCGTIHSLIYQTREKGKRRLLELEDSLETLKNQYSEKESEPVRKEIIRISELIKEEKEALNEPFFILDPESVVRNLDVLVLDECSMIDEKMGKDLLSFGTKIIVIGDPAQLPPVKSAGFFTNRKPDFMLDEIHRQAEESPIIYLASLARSGTPISLGRYGNCLVTDSSRDVDFFNFDQVLCGRNDTRHRINKFIRAGMNRLSIYPEEGEIVVCGRNNHDKGLLNGMTYTIETIGEILGHKIFMRLEDAQGATYDVCAHEHYFLGTEQELEWFEERDAEKFEFGYGLTVHKAQGSQWNNVLLKDESRVFKHNSAKWLYTGITRAADYVTIVR